MNKSHTPNRWGEPTPACIFHSQYLSFHCCSVSSALAWAAGALHSFPPWGGVNGLSSTVQSWKEAGKEGWLLLACRWAAGSRGHHFWARASGTFTVLNHHTWYCTQWTRWSKPLIQLELQRSLTLRCSAEETSISTSQACCYSLRQFFLSWLKKCWTERGLN